MKTSPLSQVDWGREAAQSLMTPRPYLMWIHFYEPQPCVECQVLCTNMVLVAPGRGACRECWGR